ncbi:MAG TPA: phenylalanine--tRNA ligase subunit beta [Chloroflexota bacterium]|nr:phenylalanine--tRNA ligase subunit beta [Chloroflexota bacterium]
MKVSLKWLRSYTPASLPPEEIAHRLTMAGVEVEDIYRIGETWNNVYVGEVAELKPHPNADRLQLATVQYGPGRSLTVVTGATNLKVGDKVPLALVGAKLLNTHLPTPEVQELKPVKLRGIVSEGMVCSAKELGIGEDHAGILILDRSALPGTPLAEELGDVIFDIDVTPNRVDLFSMIGVAREVAALLEEPFLIPSATYPSPGPLTSAQIDVRIADPDLCPRYSAAIIHGVKIGQSPKWLRDRLTAIGSRPINNVVDVTNYVMLEWGQPLHAFDYHKVRGKQIIVRRAGDGESIVLLDGSTRGLTSNNLVIADVQEPVAIAGVMGGADSEVTSETTSVLIESANFNALSVRRTARGLKLLTDAAHRFERALPTELPIPALQRAVQLLLEVAGGEATNGIVDVYPKPAETIEIFLTSHEVKRLLGIDLSTEEIRRLLERVGCRVEGAQDGLQVVPPMQRTDLTIPADLCEEIARLLGYYEVPSTLPSGEPPEPTINLSMRWLDEIRDTLVGLGLNEIVTYSLTSRERLGRLIGADVALAGASSFMESTVAAAEEYRLPHDLAQQVSARFVPLDVQPVEVVNPLSADNECLRTTSFGTALETLSDNLRHAERDVLLFEIGHTYLPRLNDLPDERNILTVVAGAYRSGPTWGSRIENDFFWLKSIAEASFDRLGIGERAYRPLRHHVFHGARSAAILVPGQPDKLLGALGEVEPGVRAAFDVDQPAYLLAIDLDLALSLASAQRTVQPIPRFPPVVQDLAVIVGTDVTAEAIERLIREAGMPLVKSVELFDIYQGPPIPAGKINLAFHITYQAPDRTLTDIEVAALHDKIERALVGTLGAELRR